MKRWPYALPNIASAVFLLSAAFMLFLGLDETHEVLCTRPDRGRQLGIALSRLVWRKRRDKSQYSAVPTLETIESPIEDIEMQTPVETKLEKVKKRRKLPIRRIWTRNVIVIKPQVISSYCSSMIMVVC